MKRTVTLLTLFTLALPAQAATNRDRTLETTTTKTRNIRINPLGLLFGSLSGDVDFALTPKITLGPSFSYYSASLGSTSLSGIGIGVRSNFYLTGEAMTDSWIVGPGLGINRFAVSNSSSDASTTSFYIGAVLGHQWVWKSGFNVNLGLGANYYAQSATATASDGSQVDVPGFQGLGPTAELTLGWAF